MRKKRGWSCGVAQRAPISIFSLWLWFLGCLLLRKKWAKCRWQLPACTAGMPPSFCFFLCPPGAPALLVQPSSIMSSPLDPATTQLERCEALTEMVQLPAKWTKSANVACWIYVYFPTLSVPMPYHSTSSSLFIASLFIRFFRTCADDIYLLLGSEH